MTTIKVGDWIRKIGPGVYGWNEFYEVESISPRGDLISLYTTNKRMVFVYNASDHEWEILPRPVEQVEPADIDHFEYDGFRLPRSGEWFAMSKMPEMIARATFDFETDLHHIYRPIRKIRPVRSETPITDKFEEEGW